MLRVFVRLASFVTAKRKAGAADRRIARPTGRWSQSIDEATEPRPMHQDQTTCAGGALGSCRKGATLRVASRSDSNASPYPQAASRARSRYTLLSTQGTAVSPRRIQVFFEMRQRSPGGVPRASFRFALGYLLMPLWGWGTMNPSRGGCPWLLFRRGSTIESVCGV